MPDLYHEQLSKEPVAGVDEAGRGPWAGPVISAAVILGSLADSYLLKHIKDSKELSFKAREDIFPQIIQNTKIGIGRAEVEEIDNINILAATHLSMERAIKSLPMRPNTVLIDGNSKPNIDINCKLIVKGDSISSSIAAASIVAKVLRDREMIKLSTAYPGYGFERHKGYGTKEHAEALRALGPSPVHRHSFKPIKKYLLDH